MIKALVCDIDNTLADGVSWYKITESLGASTQAHQKIFEEYLAGEISYAESKVQLIGLWRSSGKVTKKHFNELFEGWQLRDGASELIGYVRKKGWQPAIITGSVDLFAEVIARRLAVSHWYANTRLVWSEDGDLVDYDYQKDQATVKLQQLHTFARTSNIDLHECAVVGDGDNDLAIFRATGNGIAIGDAHPALNQAANKRADSLREVPRLLEEL